MVKRLNYYLAAALAVLVITALLPHWFFDWPAEEIIFNQHLTERWQSEYRSANWREACRRWWSYQTLVWSSLFNQRTASLEVDDVDSVFLYVFSRVPPYAVVYPTETYYYFKIPTYGLSGNLRFADIDRGELSFAYFYTDRPHSEEGGSKTYASTDGLLVKQLSDFVYDVSFRGVKRRFHLPSLAGQLPPRFSLLPEEEFVAKIRDESGLLFLLIYNNQTKSFYYALDEEWSVNDELTEVFERVSVGRRTGFAFYEDDGRKILFGVDSRHIWQNDYYDGPFDQVPPHLLLRDRLYAAYPYTQYLHGLDEYGNFIDFHGSRVAISAYTDSGERAVLEKRLEQCRGREGGLLWSCLTYEPKKDFHKTIPEFFYEDGRCKEQCLLERR